MEVVAGELLGEFQSFSLGGVAHDVKRIDEGVQLLHREVIGDECLSARSQPRDGELHRVVVQSVNLKLKILAAATDLCHFFHVSAIGAVEAEGEGRGGVGGVDDRACVGCPCSGIIIIRIETGTIVIITGEIQIAILHLIVADGEGTGFVFVGRSIGNITGSSIRSVFLNGEIVVATLQLVGFSERPLGLRAGIP